MQHLPLHTALNLEPSATIQLTALEMVMWGRELHFSGHADMMPFELRFLDCRELRWQLYSHLQDENNPPHDLRVPNEICKNAPNIMIEPHTGNIRLKGL